MLNELVFLSLLIVAECGINVNDILDVNYLPGTLLLENFVIDSENGANRTSANNVTAAGKWTDAFETMNFHRKMMNEYLCRSYVAEQILNDMEPSIAYNRLGSPADNDSPTPKSNKIDLSAVKDSLLADQGSSHYKNWLARTTTLEDIYRHYEDLAGEDDGSHDEPHSAVPEYDGEVTGYAVHNTVPQPVYGPPAKPSYGTGGGGGGGGHGFSSYGGGGGGGPSYSSSGGGTGYSSSGSGGGYSYHPSEKSDKGMALKDLFELALTALAFLAFGMFKLNVIMCIFGGNGGMTTMATGAAEEVNTKLRSERAANFGVGSAQSMNLMAQRVLQSIEAFLHMQHDDGECLRQTLCDNNRFSRTLFGTDRIWLPVWSLGLSWVAGRFSPNQFASAAMLEYLRASILGLGNSKCESIYPRCSLEKMSTTRTDRRRRRRKKRHGDPGEF